MLSDAQRDLLKPLVRTVQIIVGALAIGVLNFLIVVVAIAFDDQRGPVDQPFLTYIAAGSAAFAVVASIFVPMILAGQLRQSSPDASATSKEASRRAADDADIRPPAQMYQTLLIIKCAIIEGAAFLCLIGFLLERQSIGLVVAGILLLTLLAQFPTMSRLEVWIENELAAAEQIRQLR